MRVLVVDDVVHAADTLASILSMYGHQVSVAYDGHAALGVAQAEQPHAVVLDLELPKLDGFSVAQRLRKECGATLLLIACSGWTNAAAMQRARVCGFDVYFTKPVDIDALLNALHPNMGGPLVSW